MEGCLVTYADRCVMAASEGDIRRAVEMDLKEVARSELIPRLEQLAAQHGLKPHAVTIGNQRSRWGSCSKNGRIALNFRLVQVPPDIGDYVMLHELMHMRQQNHSRRFWQLVEAACPNYRDAERWLRKQGRGLF
jgi:predicted metal-dependent hydrolase